MKIKESTIVGRVGAKALRLKMEKCVESRLQRQQWRNFQLTKFVLTDFVLTDRRNLLGKWPKSACCKSSSCRFSLSAATIRENCDKLPCTENR